MKTVSSKIVDELGFKGLMAFFDRYKAYFENAGIYHSKFTNGYNKAKKAGEIERKYAVYLAKTYSYLQIKYLCHAETALDDEPLYADLLGVIEGSPDLKTIHSNVEAWKDFALPPSFMLLQLA